MFYIGHTNGLLFSFALLTINMLHIEHTNQLHCMWSIEYRPLKYNVVIGRVEWSYSNESYRGFIEYPTRLTRSIITICKNTLLCVSNSLNASKKHYGCPISYRIDKQGYIRIPPELLISTQQASLQFLLQHLHSLWISVQMLPICKITSSMRRSILRRFWSHLKHS